MACPAATGESIAEAHYCRQLSVSQVVMSHVVIVAARGLHILSQLVS